DNAGRAHNQIEQHFQQVEKFWIHNVGRVAAHHLDAQIYFVVNASSARLSGSTFTPGSPRKPRLAESVFARMSSRTLSSPRPRALATRGVCSSALRKLMCGSRPLAEAVTASAGTGVLVSRLFCARYAAIFCTMVSCSFCEVGPRL